MRKGKDGPMQTFVNFHDFYCCEFFGGLRHKISEKSNNILEAITSSGRHAAEAPATALDTFPSAKLEPI